MIQPVNGHLIIEPLKHESFMALQKESYEEIGVVVDYDRNIKSGKSFYADNQQFPILIELERGSKVYFDSWLAAKYPKGVDGEYYWLVKWEDIRAVENNA